MMKTFAIYYLSGLAVLALILNTVEAARGPVNREPRTNANLVISLVMSFVSTGLLLWLLWVVE